MLPDPRYIDIRGWADAAAIELVTWGPVPRLDDERRWLDWADALGNLKVPPGVQLPDPRSHASWQGWAEALINVLLNVRPT